MHIEPGIVPEAKIGLSYITAAGAGLFGLKLAADAVREYGAHHLARRSLAATALVFCFFQILPHYPVGVSEVHLILGSTLFLTLGVAPAAIGLACGLLLQGLFFAPFDLPQYGMNMTTLLVPLFGLAALSRRIVSPATPYVDLRYGQALALSTSYQAGIVAWVAFWVLYGQGISLHSLARVSSFGGAYMLVVVVEPVVDLAVLAMAKTLHSTRGQGFFERRLHQPA